jgi:hypothetical protein
MTRATEAEGSNESRGPDYESVEITSDNRSEYTYTERRKELLLLARQRGGFSALNQTRLAAEYDVSQQQISKDLDRLATYHRAKLDDRDRRIADVDLVLDRCIRGLLEDEEYRKAAKTATERAEFRREEHDLEALEERLDALEARAESGGGR